MSEFKTNKISPRSGTTQTIGDSGDSVSTSSGSTINNAGTITTAGITGGTINNTTGSIYLRGEVDWQPSDIKTASFTATDNQGFFVNTTSGEITVTLPASPSAGDVVGIKDYANTFDTNKCILNANGNKIQGSTELFEITVEGSSIIIIYVDATQGWVITDASKAADISQQALFTVATGGTITCSGDFKIHTFTGPGTFTVTQIGNAPTNPLGGPSNVDYLVVAGGGGGGFDTGGGGGAGGFRESHSTPVSGCYTASPLATPTGIIVTSTTYPITVGSGGTAGTSSVCVTAPNGSDSIFGTITSAGGGGAGRGASAVNSADGGSGGGGAAHPSTPRSGGAGNTPPVSPPQGNAGANGVTGTGNAGSGGGGATATGSSGTFVPSPLTRSGGNGGAGTTTSINGTPTAYAGGGAGGGVTSAGSGGSGGGGDGGNPGCTGTAGTANTGGGGGAGGPSNGNAGGSGIVIIRYKFQ
jgi:hypothetical protein